MQFRLKKERDDEMKQYNKQKHIMRCPSNKMLEKIIAILDGQGMIYKNGMGGVPVPDVIRSHWEDTNLKFYNKEIDY